MRKLILSLTLGSVLAIAGTGCLKDKGYEAQDYGIQITEKKAVAFPESSSSPIVFGINSQVTPQTVDGPAITLEQSGAAASDVHVTVTVNQTLVSDAGLTPLPAGSFSVTPLSVTIPAGAKLSDGIKVTVNNSSLLNPTISYGVGLVITAVDNNYIIAANQKSIVVAFNIKNKYDGVYNLRGFHNRPGLDIPYDEEVDMITSGPNSVSMYWAPAGDYAHPLNGGSTYYGTFTANFTFNPATDQLIAWDWSPFATTLPTTVDPVSNSRYVPATKTIYFKGWYNNNPGARAFTDTLVYLHAR
jgi:hypothetical protein